MKLFNLIKQDGTRARATVELIELPGAGNWRSLFQINFNYVRSVRVMRCQKFARITADPISIDTYTSPAMERERFFSVFTASRGKRI